MWDGVFESGAVGVFFEEAVGCEVAHRLNHGFGGEAPVGDEFEIFIVIALCPEVVVLAFFAWGLFGGEVDDV